MFEAAFPYGQPAKKSKLVYVMCKLIFQQMYCNSTVYILTVSLSMYFVYLFIHKKGPPGVLFKALIFLINFKTILWTFIHAYPATYTDIFVNFPGFLFSIHRYCITRALLCTNTAVYTCFSVAHRSTATSCRCFFSLFFSLGYIESICYFYNIGTGILGFHEQTFFGTVFCTCSALYAKHPFDGPCPCRFIYINSQCGTSFGANTAKYTVRFVDFYVTSCPFLPFSWFDGVHESCRLFE